MLFGRAVFFAKTGRQMMSFLTGKKKLATMVLGIALLGTAALIGGCGSKDSAPAPKADTKQVLKVGTNATYVPFEFIDEKDGKKSYSGFDMDLAREIGKRLNMEVEFHNIPFDGLIPALGTGEINMAATGMVITPEREQRVSFIPYYQSGLGILVQKDATDIHNLQDLKGKRVAVQLGTTGSVAAHSVEGTIIREFDHNSEALLELKQGGADAVITAIPVAKYYLKTTTDSNAKLVEEPISKQTLGLAFSKNDTALLDKVKKAMDEMKADGTIDKLEQKWFK